MEESLLAVFQIHWLLLSTNRFKEAREGVEEEMEEEAEKEVEVEGELVWEKQAGSSFRRFTL